MKKEAVQKIVQEFMKEYLPDNGMVKVFDPTDAAAELCSRLDTICQTPKAKTTGYERAPKGSDYFFENGNGQVDSIQEVNMSCDSLGFQAANYYTSKSLACDCIRADTLMRQLRRFSAEHRDNEFRWRHSSQDKFHFYYDAEERTFGITTNQTLRFTGTIYFDTEDHCRQAIDAFRDELVWYFTEYRDTAEEF